MLTTTILVQPQETAPGGPPAQEQGSGGGFSFVPLVLIGVVFWFILIAPERKNRKKREVMLSALGKGDKVMTTSGMFGEVAQIQEDVITVQVADGVRIRFSRQSIQTITESKHGDKSES